MTVRTTVAFDPATAQRLERLAKLWGISKSETLRRALEAAEKNLSNEAGSDFSKMTPKEALKWLHANAGAPARNRKSVEQRNPQTTYCGCVF